MGLRVQVIDDERLVAHALAALLAGMGRIGEVRLSDAGREGMDVYAGFRPDVVLLGMADRWRAGMPAELLERHPDCRMLVLGRWGASFARQMLDLGVLGYLDTDAEPAVLEEALCRVGGGRRYIEPALASDIVLLPESCDDPVERLTPRELEVFTLLAGGDTVRDIAGRLGLSPKTVNVHRASILKKMKVGNVVQLTHIAMRHGLLDI